MASNPPLPSDARWATSPIESEGENSCYFRGKNVGGADLFIWVSFQSSGKMQNSCIVLVFDVLKITVIVASVLIITKWKCLKLI